jgi:hypothetical protein
MDFGIDFIRKLKPCSWRYTGDLDDGVVHFGFIAQEVDQLASHDHYAFVQYGADDVYRLVLGEFIGPIVKAVQDIDARLTRLEAEKGEHETCNVGHDKARNGDTLGDRHDLASDLGDIRNVREAAMSQAVFRRRKNPGKAA